MSSISDTTRERKWLRYLDKIFQPEITDIILDFMKEPFIETLIQHDWNKSWCVRYVNITIGDIFASDIKEILQFIKKLKDDDKTCSALLALDEGSHEIWYYPESKRYIHLSRGYTSRGDRVGTLDVIITPSEKEEIINAYTSLCDEMQKFIDSQD